MNGAIIVNKDINMTSRDVVNKLNHILGTKAIGHTGTLDPIATGVLVCLVGKYTKLNQILTNHDKEYIASFKLGLLTGTLDITGNVISREKVSFSYDEILKVLHKFKGSYEQEVPIYSAVKINGKKLYEYARNNEEVELPKRMVTIKTIELLSYENGVVTIKCHVSKGTYIRSLIRDIGNKLNTNATMISLVRTKLGNFDIKDAYSLDDIANGKYKLLSLDEILNIKIIDMDDDLYFKVYNGQKINGLDDQFVLFKYRNQDIALYQNINNELRMFIKF